MLNYNEDVKNVIRNLRSKLVTRYQQPPFNKQIQRGGYISTKKEEEPIDTARIFSDFLVNYQIINQNQKKKENKQ